jgi:8-oxo-dGTP pyrophosphatase MutT (NUDIX family)
VDTTGASGPTAAPPRLSAGVVVVRALGGQWHYLLLRAFRNWDFPKGRVEAGEAPLHAAIRETGEESGLGNLDFRWGMDFCETEPYARGKVARYYLALSPAGQVELPVSPELGRPEHDEFRWVDDAQARGLLPTRLVRVLEWAQAVIAGAHEPNRHEG